MTIQLRSYYCNCDYFKITSTWNYDHPYILRVPWINGNNLSYAGSACKPGCSSAAMIHAISVEIC